MGTSITASSNKDLPTETSVPGGKTESTSRGGRLETGSYMSARSVGSRSIGMNGNKKIPPIYYIDNTNALNPSED